MAAITEPTILLIVRDAGHSRVFRYTGKNGKEYLFEKDPETNLHVCAIPLSEWKANHLALAKNLLEQPLYHPIIFDVALPDATDASECDSLRAILTMVAEQLGDDVPVIPIDGLPDRVASLKAQLSEAHQLRQDNEARIAELEAAISGKSADSVDAFFESRTAVPGDASGIASDTPDASPPADSNPASDSATPDAATQVDGEKTDLENGGHPGQQVASDQSQSPKAKRGRKAKPDSASE